MIIVIGLTLLLLLPINRLLARADEVVLIDFTAMSLPGLPEVYLEWETAYEFDAVGFFVSRSLSATMAYTRVSDFIPCEGDVITGTQYFWLDDATELSHTYYYRLEVINSDQSLTLYGPISITAGVDSISTFFIPRAYLPLVMRMN
jgi:hypothetical protein